MIAPVIKTGHGSERERKCRRDQRAEDCDEDQGHDRKADLLGGCQILLAEILKPGPKRVLANQMQFHRAAIGPFRSSSLAQLGSDIAGAFFVDAQCQWHDERALVGTGGVDRVLRLCAYAGGEAHVGRAGCGGVELV